MRPCPSDRACIAAAHRAVSPSGAAPLPQDDSYLAPNLRPPFYRQTLLVPASWKGVTTLLMVERRLVSRGREVHVVLRRAGPIAAPAPADRAEHLDDRRRHHPAA